MTVQTSLKIHSENMQLKLITKPKDYKQKIKIIVIKLKHLYLIHLIIYLKRFFLLIFFLINMF